MMLGAAIIFFGAFAPRKNRRNVIAVSCIFILFSISLAFVKNVLLRSGIMLTCLFSITCFYQFRAYNRILYTVLFAGISSALEFIVGLCMQIILRIDVATIKGDMLYTYMGSILSNSLTLFCCYIIFQAKHKTLFGRFKLKYLSVYLLPIATFLVILFEFYAWRFTNEVSLQVIGVICIFLLAICNLLIFKVIDSMYNSIYDENRILWAESLIKQQTEQYTLMLDKNNEIVKMRHNHKNFLLGIISELNNDNVESVKARAKEELEFLDDYKKNVLTGNSVVDTLMNYKMEEAGKLNIAVNFAHKNLSEIKISLIDFSILIGNALDNAIEASARLKKVEDKVIDISVIHKEEMLIITISNAVDENIDVQHLKTSKNEKLHGFGISTMKSIAAKYKGEIILSCENKMFETVIILNNSATNVS